MKTTKFLRVALTAIAFTALTACSKDGDTTKPVINLHEPENEEYFQLGTTLHLDMDLTDNESLDEYKVDIHWAAGHTHTRAEAEAAAIYTNTWTDAKGLKSKYVHHDITLPADAAPGEYHLIVYCTDAAGNEAHAVVTIDLGTEPGESHEHEHEHR